MAEQSTEIMVREQGQGQELMPAMSIEQVIQRYNTVVQFAKKVMREGIDYGTIPGTEKKPNDDGTPSNNNHTLLKPGAEKLCTLFGLVPEFEDYRVIEDWDKGLFYYAFKCKLLRRGNLIASAIGSCNSREKKYIRVSRLCPECGAATIKRSKFAPKGRSKDKPGWYCYEKAGGCGRQFDADEPKIVGQQLENDPSQAADFVNTIQKMAQKRALVAAALIATNASEFFTQDLEDVAVIDAVVEESPTRVVDAEIVDQRSPQEQFREQFINGLIQRQFTVGRANALLAGVLKKAERTLENLDAPLMARLLDNLNNGLYDELRTKPTDKATPAATASTPASAETPRPAPGESPVQSNGHPIMQRVTPDIRQALDKKWSDVSALLREKTKDNGVGRTDFEGGLWKYLKHLGLNGKEDNLSIQDRAELYFAVVEKRFDYSTGEFTAEPLVGAA